MVFRDTVFVGMCVVCAMRVIEFYDCVFSVTSNLVAGYTNMSS